LPPSERFLEYRREIRRSAARPRPSLSPQESSTRDLDRLSTLPAELLLIIYEALSSFAAAFCLRAICRAIHNVWSNNRKTTATQVLIQRIECYPYSHQLLATMGPQQTHNRWEWDAVSWTGPPVDQIELSDLDLMHLERNAQQIERVIEEVEKKENTGTPQQTRKWG
jgi:hypothetical protein